MNNIMLDLETLGTRPGSIIASIGAVRFLGGAILDRFHVRLDINSQVWSDCGFTADPDTLSWWDKQSPEAREELEGSIDPLDGLGLFAEWATQQGPVDTIWGNGPTMDNAILSEAYFRFGLERPWSYKADRCYRTLRALSPTIKAPAIGTEHNAVDDAERQALHLMRIVDI